MRCPNDVTPQFPAQRQAGGHRSPPTSCWFSCQESEVSTEKDKDQKTIPNTAGPEQSGSGQQRLEEYKMGTNQEEDL